MPILIIHEIKTLIGIYSIQIIIIIIIIYFFLHHTRQRERIKEKKTKRKQKRKGNQRIRKQYKKKRKKTTSVNKFSVKMIIAELRCSILVTEKIIIIADKKK